MRKSDRMDDVNNKYREIFKQTSIMHDRFEQVNAFNHLIENVDIDNIPNEFLKEYYYYLGASKLSGFNDTKKALYYFDLGLKCVKEKSNLFFHALLVNMMGIVYFKNDELRNAKECFDRSLQMLAEIEDWSISNYDKTLLIHFNTAKFYSEINEFERVVDICNQAIKLAFEENLMFHLEKIYYEKAFNLAKLERFESAEKSYTMSMLLAEAKENSLLIKIIKNDILKFKIKSETRIL